MSKQTALFTIALLLTFISTQVIHTSAAEPGSSTVTTQKPKSPKSKSKNSKHHSHRPRKHDATNTKGTSKKQ